MEFLTEQNVITKFPHFNVIYKWKLKPESLCMKKVFIISHEFYWNRLLSRAEQGFAGRFHYPRVRCVKIQCRFWKYFMHEVSQYIKCQMIHIHIIMLLHQSIKQTENTTSHIAVTNLYVKFCCDKLFVKTWLT